MPASVVLAAVRFAFFAEERNLAVSNQALWVVGFSTKKAPESRKMKTSAFTAKFTDSLASCCTIHPRTGGTLCAQPPRAEDRNAVKPPRQNVFFDGDEMRPWPAYLRKELLVIPVDNHVMMNGGRREPNDALCQEDAPLEVFFVVARGDDGTVERFSFRRSDVVLDAHTELAPDSKRCERSRV